jgi:hypothetical protein
LVVHLCTGKRVDEPDRDLLAWTQHLLLHGRLAKAEPKTLRYRLLHVAARLTPGQRWCWLRIQRTWPWAHQLPGQVAEVKQFIDDNQLGPRVFILE